MRDTPISEEQDSLNIQKLGGDSLASTFKKQKPLEQFNSEFGIEEQKDNLKTLQSNSKRMISYSVDNQKEDFADQQQDIEHSAEKK